MSEATFGKILVGLCVVLFVAWRAIERAHKKMNRQHPEHDNGTIDPGPLPAFMAGGKTSAHVRGKGNDQPDGYFDATGDGD